jgi:hypothetical protein
MLVVIRLTFVRTGEPGACDNDTLHNPQPLHTEYQQLKNMYT